MKTMKKRGKITAVDALANFMTKQHGAPEYEFLNKFGKSHKPWFRFRCQAMDDTVVGTGRSKAEAKQIVARMMLEHLSMRGYIVPPEFACPHAMDRLMEQAGLPTHSFVVLLKELCNQFRLDPVEYYVYADPAGQPRSYTVKARIGQVQRFATGSSKRIAHNLAAEQIYRHLCSKLQAHLEEERVIYRAYDRAMAPTSDEEEDNADEQPNTQEELQDEAAAAPRRNRRNRRKKNRRSSAAQAAAVQESINLELEPREGSHEVGPSRLPCAPTPEAGAAIPLDHAIAMRFLIRTVERLGI